MSFSDFVSNMDVFGSAYREFQRDVHVIIEGTLHASILYLDEQAKKELRGIEEAIKQPIDDEYQQHLVDEHVDVLETNSGQERFIRNMALVALASRLTHALRTMARSAETFSPRKKRYGATNLSEFTRLWIEYQERFGIDFVANCERIAFVDTMREVRNQIVHEGSEANPPKPQEEIDLERGDAGYLDMRFSLKYPAYVSGEGVGAEVSVSEEQLSDAIKRSVELVGWLAGELRKRELASFGKSTSKTDV